MKRFLIRCLLFSSLTMLINGSCSIKRLSLSPVTNPETVVPFHRPFLSPGTELLYKAKVDIRGNPFSGLFAIRIYPDETYRVVFLNELGMKFFDFETGSKGLTAHHCFEAFQKSGVRKILEESFRI